MKAALTVLLAISTTVLCIALLKPLAPKLKLVDYPSGRKKHEGEIPLVGGIAVWLAFVISLLFIGLTPKLGFLIVAGGMLVFVGAIDDATTLSPRGRLMLHVCAALVASVLGGVVVGSLGELILPGKELALGVFAIPFTVFAIVALVNAVNMSDGLDGLCGLQVLIPLVGLTFLAGISGDQANFLPLLAICGSLLGFLFFNLRTPWRRRASVFLGDAGSNFLGLVLAWFLIDMSQGDDAVLKPVAVLWFALLLIYDTVEVVARRLTRRKSPFAADREHLHHVFLMAKFSVSESVMTLGAFALIGVLIGIVVTYLNVPESAVFAAFILFGLLFLRWIFHTWSVMRFLYRSICRRSGERRKAQATIPDGVDRRSGKDRRREPPETSAS
ncbi:MAG: MraY family glycosyltransferase [Woeseiaceae bacterium]|nr:MraY family glycosyltransferase [Woeseiaceae bacterium]